jgi:hypothetical protein
VIYVTVKPPSDARLEQIESEDAPRLQGIPILYHIKSIEPHQYTIIIIMEGIYEL